MLKGLASRPELNGIIGRVVEAAEGSDPPRWVVELKPGAADKMKVKAVNMRRLPPSKPPPAPPSEEAEAEAVA